MLGGAVDEQRLQRGEKIPRWIGHAPGGLPVLERLLALAKFRAQFFQKRRGAGYFIAADFQPLEFGEKIAARLRGQPLQIIFNPIGLHHCQQSSEV